MHRAQPLQRLSILAFRIRTLGYDPSLDEYEKRKLSIFNYLNFFGLITGIILPIAGIFNNDNLPLLAWIVAFSPFLISSGVLLLNYYKRYESARMFYFILYPVITSLVYAGNADVGIELFFIAYGVLCVYLIKNKTNIIFTFLLSASCYFLVFVFAKEYALSLKSSNFYFYAFNQLLAFVFIFLSLFFTKDENAAYRINLLKNNETLQARNDEIEMQKTVITEKALQLEKQATELMELNSVKNKLFSIIAHDLRNPLYAQRTLFTNMEKYDIPAEEIKAYVPEIIKDLNYSTDLIENLLQWAKSQIQDTSVQPQVLDVSKMIDDVLNLMKLQAENKKIYLLSKIKGHVYCNADRDMINLVLRNLISNAIKFTPEQGNIYIDAGVKGDFVEVSVTDTGMGISPEILPDLFANKFISTHGTSKEAGSGLGLMLCKDFLQKNGGNIAVKSELGKGTSFSFTLPGFSDKHQYN